MSIDLAVVEGVAHLRLNRPDRANAIDLSMAHALHDRANELHARRDVRAVVMTGAGDRFCGGGDLKAFVNVRGDLGDHLEELTSHLHAGIVRLHDLPAPLVVGAHGVAAGAGFSLACGADLLVLGDRTRMVMAYAGVGLTPDGSGSWFLPRRVGLGRALDMALTNRMLEAAEALSWGLASRVVAEADVEAEALALGRTLASGPARSLAAAKRLLHESLGRSLAGQLVEETRALGAAARRPEGVEGIRAFVERRPANFSDS